MTIRQLSIFIENKSGSLLQVLSLLRDNGINIVFSTLGDTLDFGIYRVICSDTAKAFSILRQKGINATVSNVYAIRLASNRIGAAADIISLITEAGVDIKYLYSFMMDNAGILVFRTDNNDKADEVIMLNKLDFLTDNDLAKF